MASRLLSVTSPTTVLDVGCGDGGLVEAMREHGVDARGFDASREAVAAAGEHVRPHVWVQSVTDPVAGHVDLVTCIGVFDHLPPDESELVVDSVCAVTDQVLVAPGPDDGTGTWRLDGRRQADLVTAFAERGLFRRTDVNLDFLSGRAVLLVRRGLTARDVVARYESSYAVLHDEVLVKRTALREVHDELRRLHTMVNDPDAGVRLEKERAQVERARAETEGLLRHAEREIAARDEEVAALVRLVDNLEAHERASDLRILELSEWLKKSRSAERRSKQQLRVVRRKLKRMRQLAAQQRVAARRAEQELSAVTSSRTYRIAGVLGRPRRAWTSARRRARRAVGSTTST